jgi:ligand-binding SRPBCC domain-containing protein
MQTHILERSQIIHRSLEETFAFFSDAYNLAKITPDFLHFKILTPHPIAMHPGALIDYSLSLFGVPFKWQTVINEWEPNVRFVDSQVKGPYALWQHTHTFKALDEERTLMLDEVHYQIPMGVLGDLAHDLFVEATLKKIFAYRYEATERLLMPVAKNLSVSNPATVSTTFATDIK